MMKASLPKPARVVAIAVDSSEKDVHAVVEKLKPNARVVLASPEIRQAFSGPPAVRATVRSDHSPIVYDRPE
jgi:hypothetical protein